MHLIATIGTNRYREAEYYFENNPDRICRTCYGPVATAELLGGVDHALILLTKEAEQAHWIPLQEQFKARGITERKLAIPFGRSEDEIWQGVQRINESIEKGAELVVDVTHAFRHIPILMLTSLAYLTAERDVRIRGVYYGAWEARTGDRAPVFDLTPFLTLTECHHAVRQFRETGDARRLVKCLGEINSAQWKHQAGSPDFSTLVKALGKVSSCLVTALPLEAGFQSAHALQSLPLAAAHMARTPAVAGSLVGSVAPTLERFAVQNNAREKREIVLNLAELERQLQVIRFSMESQAYDRVLLLLREWIINRCLLAAGKTDTWLEYNTTRKLIEVALNCMAERIIADRFAVSGPQRELVRLWNQTAARRNPYAHAGFCPKEVAPESDVAQISTLIAECESRCKDDHNWRVESSASLGNLLVTPLGLAPGVLFTALLRTQPDGVLVVTSRQGALLIPEACRRAGFAESGIRIELVEDPHRSFRSAEELAARVRSLIMAARCLTVNVTGGTTVLQYLVERIGRDAERLGTSVHRIALVDSRPYSEQQANPYVPGEVICLDGDE